MTPYVWSDYHFIIENANVSFDSWSSDAFQNSGLVDDELSFWAPEWIEVGETVEFTLDLNVAEGVDTFTIAQVATTVPVPAAAWLLGSGVVGLVGLRRKMKR